MHISPNNENQKQQNNIFLPSPILKGETEAPESLVPSGKTKKTIINSRTKFGVCPFCLTD